MFCILITPFHSMIATIMPFHQCFRTTHLYLGIKGIIHSKIRVTDRGIPDISGTRSTESCGPETLGDLRFNDFVRLFNNLFCKDKGYKLLRSNSENVFSSVRQN